MSLFTSHVAFPFSSAEALASARASWSRLHWMNQGTKAGALGRAKAGRAFVITDSQSSVGPRG